MMTVIIIKLTEIGELSTVRITGIKRRGRLHLLSAASCNVIKDAAIKEFSKPSNTEVLLSISRMLHRFFNLVASLFFFTIVIAAKFAFVVSNL